MRAVSSFESHKISRRSLLIGGIAGAIGAQIGIAQTPRLETLTQWLNASRSKREDALQRCIDRIREMDPSIHARVQVLPQKPTGDGKPAGIPFGAKDIIETRGLATEYGSSIYKGRIGTKDAAIIRELRQRERSCWKNSNHGLRIFHTWPNAQPQGFGTHAGRNLSDGTVRVVHEDREEKFWSIPDWGESGADPIPSPDGPSCYEVEPGRWIHHPWGDGFKPRSRNGFLQLPHASAIRRYVESQIGRATGI